MGEPTPAERQPATPTAQRTPQPKERTEMAKINWKVAAIGGAAIGAAVGGFTLAGADDSDTQPIRDVDLQSYRDDIRSLSSPVEVTTTTKAPTATVAPAPQSPVSPPSPVSANSPVAPRQAPAPAPMYSPASPPSAPSVTSAPSAQSAASVASAPSAASVDSP